MPLKPMSKHWQNATTAEKFFGVKLTSGAKLVVQKDELCEVCQRPIRRNNPNQIMRYHSECRQNRL